jgi:hypothetical protein
MKAFRGYLKIFFFAFLFNFLWENLHAPLYLHYRGGVITELILARAALVDAFLILVLVIISRAQKISQRRTLFIFLAGLFIAIILEKWALVTGRWAYGPSMPLMPILNIGLTPAIQLGLTGWLSYRTVFQRIN